MNELTLHNAQTYEAMGKIATTLVRSRFCNVSSDADALWIIATGASLGIDPVTSLRGIHIVNGRPVMSADLMAATCLRHPACIRFVVVEMNSEAATVEVLRRGWDDPQRYSFTWNDAQAARLTNKDNWKKHPADMLKARAISRAARAAFPDALMGCYVDGEIEAGDEPDAYTTPSHVVDVQVLDVEPAPRLSPSESLRALASEAVGEELGAQFVELYVEKMGGARLEDVDDAKISAMVGKLKAIKEGRPRETYIKNAIEKSNSEPPTDGGPDGGGTPSKSSQERGDGDATNAAEEPAKEGTRKSPSAKAQSSPERGSIEPNKGEGEAQNSNDQADEQLDGEITDDDVAWTAANRYYRAAVGAAGVPKSIEEALEALIEKKNGVTSFRDVDPFVIRQWGNNLSARRSKPKDGEEWSERAAYIFQATGIWPGSELVAA